MEKARTRTFTQSMESPAVLSVLLEAWWKVASTPADMVDVLIATAGAGVLAGVLGACQCRPGDTAHPLDRTGLNRREARD